jgi:hypothetical protein
MVGDKLQNIIALCSLKHQIEIETFIRHIKTSKKVNWVEEIQLLFYH